jgi:heme/copper-type cytochrome/quinol oxidase subunit 3
MILFIASEVMFFFAFFWAFFHSSLNPSIGIGCQWPPKGIETLDPWSLPLLNTFILLSSGATVTWAHHAIIYGSFSNAILALGVTVGLGLIFSVVQAYEYLEASYGLTDSVFGSTFYMLTGFHGFHVFVGTLFLLVCLIRLNSGHFTRTHHVGFEAAAWYWHFVDVIWIFVFLFIYVWGGK